MQIATLLIIAFFVTHYVNIKTSNKINRKEAVLEIVKKFQGSIDNVYSCGYKYILDSNSGSNVEHSILAHLRSASNYLNMIQKFKKDEVQELNSFDEIYCKQKLLDLKISITDSPFKTSNHIYSPDQIISFDRNYTDLIDLIYKFRTNFWL